MVVLGDSLSAGYGLAGTAAFPTRLQNALDDKGIKVDMINAGVSGDTSSGGRDRLDWSVPEGTDAVILELGANDALRGTDPAVTRAALSDILTRLKAREYRGPALRHGGAAELWQRLLGTFQRDLSGTRRNRSACRSTRSSSTVSRLTPSSIRPTECIRLAEGVDIIVKNILPTVEAFLGTISRQRS